MICVARWKPYEVAYIDKVFRYRMKRFATEEKMLSFLEKLERKGVLVLKICSFEE